jgi:hypothetical protein
MLLELCTFFEAQVRPTSIGFKRQESLLSSIFY